MKTLMALFIKYKSFFVIGALILFSIAPLFHAGLIPTHDGEYHLIRFYEFDKILRTGNWYPRWAPDLDFSYGLPLFTFVYPLPNYVASLLHFFGTSFLDSVKLVMVIATFCGGIFMYLWTKEFWGKTGALVSTTVYLFAPYRFVDIYVRGSVGEVLALGIFPGFLWAYTKYLQTKKPIFLALSALFLALTIFSHNILGLMFFAFALCYMAFFLFTTYRTKHMVIASFFILLLSLGLSAIFWIPALTETHFVRGLQVYNIAQNFPDLFQLLFPSWGSGFFDSNLDNEMSVQIGLTNLLACIIAGIVFVKLWRKKDKNRGIILFSLLSFIILFYFMLPFSLPLWKTIPLIHYFQFPWRLLSLVILMCAFMAGSIVYFKHAKIFAGIGIIFAVVITYAYTQPAYYMVRSDAYYISRSNFIDSTNSPGNVFNTIWNTTRTKRPQQIFIPINNVTITKITKQSPTDFSATATVRSATTQIIAVSYFPGWQVTIDGQKTSVIPTKKGLISFRIPKGIHSLRINLQPTEIEYIAQNITLFSILLLLLLVLRKQRK